MSVLTDVTAGAGKETRELTTDALWQAPRQEAAIAIRVTGRRRRRLFFMGPIYLKAGPILIGSSTF
jgi:hypothetical protein